MPSRRQCMASVLDRRVPFHLSEPGESRCLEHRGKSWARRPATDARYHSADWARLRKRVLAEEPTCRLRLEGCTLRSTQVDHVVSANERPDLFLRRSNVRGVCRSCHDKRSSRQARKGK